MILATENTPKDSREARPYLHRVQDQPWSFNGPYRPPKRELKILETFLASFRLCLPMAPGILI